MRVNAIFCRLVVTLRKYFAKGVMLGVLMSIVLPCFSVGKPTSQPSAIVFSNMVTNSITVSFTKAPDNPTGYLLIYRIGVSPTNGAPVDGKFYSIGNSLGGGIVGGKGSSPFSLTSLSPGQQYYVDIYSYNISGPNISYQQALLPLEGNAWTLTPAPTAQPTNLTFNSVTTTGFSGSFVAASPAPSGGYLGLRRSGNAVTDVPVAGTFYSAGNTIGSSTVAFSGTSLLFTESGLAPTTTYYYKIFSYAVSSDPATANYDLGGTPLSNNQQTLVLLAPPAPMSSAATQVSASSFTANWITAPRATSYFIDVSLIADFTSLIPGFDNQEIAGLTAQNVTGLSSGTVYYYRLRATNAGGTSGNSAVISQITVPAIPISQNGSNEQLKSFIANWTAVTGADSYELDVTLGSSDFATYLNGYNGLIIAKGTQTQQVVMGLTANTIYAYRLRARNVGGVSGNSSTKLDLTLGGTALPPTIAITSSTSTDLQAQSSNGFNPSTNVIYFVHRKITQSLFMAEAGSIGSSIDILVNPNWLDQIGLEYYFMVQDEAGKRDSTESHFIYSAVSEVNLVTQSNFVSGGTAQSYRMFSIPLQLTSNRIEDIFQPVEAQYEGIDKSKWRLVHYQNGQNLDYGSGLNTIDQGRSYWFNSLNAPVPVPVSGTIIQANQKKTFPLALDAGFTQIGNPYPFSISWSNVLTQNADVPGIEGVGSLYTFDSPYVAFTTDANVLAAWGGGFVHSNVSMVINIPVTVTQARIGSSTVPGIMTQSIDQPQWFMPINITQGILHNNFSGLGMHPDAQEGYDRYDGFTPPRFINFLELNAYHNDYHTSRFSRDIVPTADHHNWSFEVESNSDEPQAMMSWDKTSLGNNAAQLFLFDLAANVIIDMKKHDHYPFEIRAKRSFKIFFGEDENSVSPDVTLLGTAYPNPFSQSTSLPFVTSASQPSVQIELYDMMGKKVRELATGHFEPGYHEAVWDGTDEQGRRASQGIYVYRLTSADKAPQMGRIILQ